MKVVVFGGSGFIGSHICEQLVAGGHIVTSVSRGGKPEAIIGMWSDKMTWLTSDILSDTTWQSAVKEADWVIDTIGILFEKKRKGITYDRFIIEPVKLLLSYLESNNNKAHFLFISASAAPFILGNYLETKKRAEEMLKKSNIQHVVFYPSMVIGKGRFFDTLIGNTIIFLKKIPILKNILKDYAPVDRKVLSMEIVKVIEGGSLIYTERRQT